MSVDITDYRLVLTGIIAIAIIIIALAFKVIKNTIVKAVIAAVMYGCILLPVTTLLFNSNGLHWDASVITSTLLWVAVLVIFGLMYSKYIKPKSNEASNNENKEAKELKEKTEVFAKELLEKCNDINIVGVDTDIENEKVIIRVENLVYGEGFLQENRETIDDLVKKHYGSNWKLEIEEFEYQVFTK